MTKTELQQLQPLLIAHPSYRCPPGRACYISEPQCSIFTLSAVIVHAKKDLWVPGVTYVLGFNTTDLPNHWRLM